MELFTSNIPTLKIGVVGVSRDCFPIELSRTRTQNVVAECKKVGIEVIQIDPIVENEKDALKALKEIEDNEINSLILYLGNFGPEGPTSLIAQRFKGPKMVCAAAEETQDNLIDGRGDAYCGLLSLSYNLKLRHTRVYLPSYPLGIPSKIAELIQDFIPIARVLIGISKLKIFTFGPRPQDFLTCHAPIQPLYDLGVEIMENSELDLLNLYEAAKNSPKIPEIKKEIEAELGSGNQYPDLIDKLAQLEACLLEFYENNLGASEFGVFANKCWPAYQEVFQHCPCYINSRLASKGIPVACEVDVYGALSEYIGLLASQVAPTILDINNTVPQDMYDTNKKLMEEKGYLPTDLFMGFHCGNTPSVCMKDFSMKYQLIMKRLLEPDGDPNISRGTLEGQIAPNQITLFRLQSDSSANLGAYIAEGEILDVDPKTFGGTGVFAIKEMGRFYRYALLEHSFPHHSAVAFKHVGKTLFEVFNILGIKKVFHNQKKTNLYDGENPF